MRTAHAHRQLIGWIAVLAVLLASIAPTLSYALGRGTAVSWTELCTSQGIKRVQLGTDDPAGAPAVSLLLEHCPCCANHVPDLAPPPAAALSAVPLPGLTDEAPHAFLWAPRTPWAWISAPARAPPRFS